MRDSNNSGEFNLNVPDRIMVIETSREDYPVLANAAISTAAAVWHYDPTHVKSQFHRFYPDAAGFLESVDEMLKDIPVAALLPADTYDDVAQDCINIACMSMLFMPPDWKQRVLAAYPVLARPLDTFRKGYEGFIAKEKK